MDIEPPPQSHPPSPSLSLEPLLHLSNTLAHHQDHLISLYTSLGHEQPARLVADKITELHTGILKTIEAQAKKAEDEVSQLIQNLDQLSQTIVNLRQRLNHHSHHHNDLQALDEQEALFPRFKRLQSIERDLINLKGDREVQAENVIQRLEHYTPILGEDYIKAIISPPNHSSQPGSFSGTDLSLEYIRRLEKECQQCNHEVSARSQTLLDHLQGIFHLWGDLGISPTLSCSSPQSDPSSSCPPDNLEDLDHSQLDRDILKHFGFEGISVTVDGDIEPIGQRMPVQIQPTIFNLKRVEARRAWLESERSNREAEIQRCYDELCPIWTSLAVPEEEQENFVESWRGLSAQCVEGYRSELARMMEARKEHMVIFVQKEREEIIKLWEQMYVGEEERTGTEMMTSSDFSEALLAAHEAKRTELTEELADRQPVLNLLGRYLGLLQEAHELQVAEKDPNRFAKGTRGDPGKLLREEKIRKRVTKEKPKLETELKKVIPQWENERGRPFLVNGSRFLDDLVTRLEQEAASKDQRAKGVGASVASVKRQQTGSQSRPASPVKRVRSVSKSKPPVSRANSVIRGSSNPFGASTPAPSVTGSSSRIVAQNTGGSRYNMRSGVLHPQRTGSSMSYYNPITPTPAYHRAPSVTSNRSHTTVHHAPSVISARSQSAAHQPAPTRPQSTIQPTDHSHLPSSASIFAPPPMRPVKKPSFRPRPSSIVNPIVARAVSISGSTNTIDSKPQVLQEGMMAE